MKKLTLNLVCMATLALPLACGGNQPEPESPEGPMEEAGEEVDEAAEDVSEGTEEGMEEAGESFEEAGDEVEEETEDED